MFTTPKHQKVDTKVDTIIQKWTQSDKSEWSSPKEETWGFLDIEIFEHKTSKFDISCVSNLFWSFFHSFLSMCYFNIWATSAQCVGKTAIRSALVRTSIHPSSSSLIWHPRHKQEHKEWNITLQKWKRKYILSSPFGKSVCQKIQIGRLPWPWFSKQWSCCGKQINGKRIEDAH